MKILLINNFYYNRGGACTYLFSLKKLLEEKGHTVIVFSMHHPQNFNSEYSRHFVSYINYEEEIRNVNISSAIKVLNRTIFSLEAKKKIEGLIREEKPDIAHLQNIHHHITPSILYSLKKYKVPVVWTLHDYTIICPNTSFFSHGRICEKCKKRKYFWPLFTRCKKDSFSASAMAALETAVHRIVGINELVDMFITPSNFLKRKIIEYGFDEKKLILLNHFVDIDSHEDDSTEDYYLFAGRIAEGKGLKTLIDSAVKVNSCKLKIAGNGPIMEKIIAYAKHRDTEKIIEFLGHKSRKEVANLFKNCKFVVVPSECHEVTGLVILEAFASGKPAIGSRIGGIPEVIKNGETGLLFEPGDMRDLSSKIEYLLNNPDMAAEIGKNAKVFAEQELGHEKHYQKLIEIYKKVISKKKK